MLPVEASVRLPRRESPKASTAPPLRQWSELDRSRARRRGRASYKKRTMVMLDSLAMLRRGGRSWLGGLDPIPDFNPLLQMASGVYLTFFGSFVFGTPGFPLSDVPQQIAADAAAGRFDVKPTRIFRFEEIREAHRVMEANEARGKMVVVHS